ncbi:hypothetical protein D3C84_173840 [compost metagenome]
MGQLIGTRIQLRVGQHLAAEYQRGRIRRALGLVLDQFVDANARRVGLCSSVPIVHQHLAFIGTQHRQLADALIAFADQCLQQARPVPSHALDGCRLEQVGGVGQRGVQVPAFFIGVQRQVELGGAALPLDQPQGQAGCGLERLNVGNMGLVVVHHLEQRVVAQAAFKLQRFDQLLERQVLVGLGAEGGFLDRAQQLADPGLPVQAGAQYLGIDEEADQAFHLGAIAVGDGHADTEIVLAGVAMQQHIEDAEQEHEQGDLMLLRKLPQLVRQFRLDGEFMAGTAVARYRRAWVIDGQFHDRMLAAECILPVTQLPRLLARLQPAPLPQGVIAVLNRQRRQLRRFASCMSVIAASEFVDQHIHRPAIGDDVVQGQQQHVLVGGQGQHLDPQQRAMVQVERQQRLLLGLRQHRLFALIFSQGAQVFALQRKRLRERHLLQTLVGITLEHRAQGFMALDQAGKGLVEGVRVQRTLEPHRPRQVVGATVGVELPEEPHALLGIGQCLAIRHLDAGRNREQGKVDVLRTQPVEERTAFLQRQFDKSAGKHHGLFSIHPGSSIRVGYRALAPLSHWYG